MGFLGVTSVCPLQGEMLDNIELNVMHTVDHVEKAREETKRAVKYQGQARKVSLSCCLRRREPTVRAVSRSCSPPPPRPSFCWTHLLHPRKGSHD